MSIKTTLKGTLGAQILMFASARWLDFNQTRHHYGDSAVLGSIVPEAFFLVLGVINLVILMLYVVMATRKHQGIDRLILVLVIVIIMIMIFYVPLTQWSIAN